MSLFLPWYGNLLQIEFSHCSWKNWLKCNIERLELHFFFDEWKFFKDFSLICKGDKRQLIYPNQSNLNASTLSVSRQIYFDFIVFWFFSETNLSIAATPHRLKVNPSNTSGVTNQLQKTLILINLSAIFVFFLWDSKK